MKKTVQKTIGILLALLSAATLGFASACTVESVEDDYVRIDPGGLPEKDVNKDYLPLEKYDQVVTVRVLGTDYTAVGEVPPTYNGRDSGPANNAFNDAALKYLNIKLQYVSTVSGERYEERLNNLIAAGELPDIFRTSNATRRYSH